MVYFLDFTAQPVNCKIKKKLFMLYTNAMNRIIFLLFTFLSFTFTACAQGYRIEVKIDGLKDTTILLGYHFGEKKFVSDTAQVDSKGLAVFQGDSLLPGGMYIVILPQHTYFDILLSDNQRFSISTSENNMMEDLTFKNSSENTAFADYQRFMGAKQQRMSELRQQLQTASGEEDAEKGIIDDINKLDKEVKAYWDLVIDENRGTFFANIIRALKPIEFPEFDIPSNASNPDSLRWVLSYQFNQKHYFDNIDLTDDRLIRTPFFHSRIDNYFDRVLLPLPDTISKYAVNLIESTKSNPKMFQFMLSHLFSKYQSSTIMGMDAVFVHIGEKYYLSGEANWISKDLFNRISSRIEELKPNLIGRVAANLRMEDINSTVRELHNVKSKITIVYFWEPGCSHCKKVTPALNEIYKTYKGHGMEVFAVYTQNEVEKWKEYVKKNELTWINVWDPNRITNYHKLYDIYSTPIIYILDKDKKIIAKRIGIESVEKFIEEEFKR
jgi:thiol-disulfide isomerase/thioredoxin